MIDPQFWLDVAALLFSIGLYGLLTRRSAVGILMAVEVMLTAAALNFVAGGRFAAGVMAEGSIAAIFLIAIAASEVVVAMAIFVALFRLRKSTDVNQMNSMKG